MEIDLTSVDLQYLNEHQSCRHYNTLITTGFCYREAAEGASAVCSILDAHTIIFVLEGEFTLSYGHYLNRKFVAGDMLFLRKSAMASWKVRKPLRLICFSFAYLQSECDKLQMHHLKSFASSVNYDFQPVAMNEPMLRFVENLEYYLRHGALCQHLHELKHREFFMILRFFYTKEQMAQLLYPILADSFDFKNWVIENYSRYYKLNDLIDASAMSRTSFLRSFKKEFCMPPYQWMKMQLCQKVRQVAAQPDVTVKDLMVVAHIDDYSQFARFCRREFHCTPKELIAHSSSIKPV